jgi:signal transduction histidine kinase
VDLDISELKHLESENLKIRLEQQQQLLNVILEAQEEERRRISESLHNGVGQILFATKLNLNQVEMNFKLSQAQGVQEGLRATEALLTEAINEARRASHELVPVLLKEYGLNAAIADFCSRFSGKGIAFSSHGIEERLPDNLEMAIYRITQELANNILKHAGATQARTEVSKHKDTLWIDAQDNGKGMTADKGSTPGKGIGLRTIADRVKLLNGKVEVESVPGKGTLVTILLPLPLNK